AGSAWASASCAPSGRSTPPADRLAGWAGRNRTASTAPAAATPPATREPIVRPRRNALVEACCSACPRAGWPRGAVWPAAGDGGGVGGGVGGVRERQDGAGVGCGRRAGGPCSVDG